jgi:hypothetical protein
MLCRRDPPPVDAEQARHNHLKEGTMSINENTMTKTGATMTQYSALNKVGFGLAMLLGALNIVSLASPTPDGEVGPPLLVLVIDAVLGVGIIVTVILGWFRGSRAAVRAATVMLILAAVTALPAFVADVPQPIVVAAAIYVLLTILTVAFMLKPRTQR